MSFGLKLRELREQTGKSQTQVAQEIAEQFSDRDISVSQATLSAWERRSVAPRQQVLEVLAEYYNVPITYFFEPEMVDDRERLERAKKYLEGLRSANFYMSGVLPHSTELRKEGDEVSRSLDEEKLREAWDSDLDEDD